VLQLEPDEELRLVAGRTMMTFRAGDVLGRFTTEVTELAAYLSAQTSLRVIAESQAASPSMHLIVHVSFYILIFWGEGCWHVGLFGAP